MKSRFEEVLVEIANIGGLIEAEVRCGVVREGVIVFIHRVWVLVMA